jgi:hypothetical protein
LNKNPVHDKPESMEQVEILADGLIDATLVTVSGACHGAEELKARHSIAIFTGYTK